jgi:L-aminopeptidase/D-esterase-like protein
MFRIGVFVRVKKLLRSNINTSTTVVTVHIGKNMGEVSLFGVSPSVSGKGKHVPEKLLFYL